MGIPQHKVVVSDPWFGQYIQCVATGYWPTVWIGPMVQRPICDEWIAGSKVPVSRNEKVVIHSYSDGAITGYGGQLTIDQYARLVGRNGGSFSQTMGDYYWRYNHEGLVTTSETPGTFVIHMRIDQWVTSAGKEQPNTRQRMMVEITFKQTKDRFTGVSTLTGVGVCKTSGAAGSYSATLKAAPYTNVTGVDAFGGTMIQSARYWLDELNSNNPLPPSSFRSLRTDAFLDALSNTDLVNINLLDDYQDAIGPLASLKKLATHFGPLKGLRSLLRAFASFRLFMEYCVKTNILTANESAKLVSFLQGDRPVPKGKNLFGDLIGRGVATKTVSLPDGSATVTCRAKAVIGSGMSPTSGLQRLQALGLMPALGDVWDCIPLSFVVDWVLPIQKNIERAEAVFRLIEMPLKLLVTSYKVEKTLHRSFAIGGHSFSIDITRTEYHRDVNNLPKGVPLSWTLDVSALNGRKALTGAALLLKGV